MFAGRDGELLTVGEMPGVTVEEARLFTDPARARGRHGLPVRARAARPGRRRSGTCTRCALRDLKASLGRWQAGLADVGWNSLYWNNHDQPRVVSRFGDDGEHRVAAAKMLGTVLHLHRGTPYVYQGEELGMTNAPFDDDRGLPRHRVAQPLRRGGGRRAPRRTTCCSSLRAMGRDNARTPMQWDARPHAGFTTGEPWIAGQPEPRRRSTPRPRAPTRTRSSTTTGG